MQKTIKKLKYKNGNKGLDVNIDDKIYTRNHKT